MICRLCHQPVGKSELSHSRTSKHLILLKKRMAKKKQISVAKYGYFKYEFLIKNNHKDIVF